MKEKRKKRNKGDKTDQSSLVGNTAQITGLMKEQVERWEGMRMAESNKNRGEIEIPMVRSEMRVVVRYDASPFIFVLCSFVLLLLVC